MTPKFTTAPGMPPRDDELEATFPPQSLTPAGTTPAASATAPVAPPATEAVELAARRIAAKQLRVDVDQVTLRGIKSVQWPDRTLGCAAPSDQTLGGPTPGYLATVEVNGKLFSVHMDAQGRGMICLESRR